jgi:uncharacterized protein YbcI
VSVLQLERAGIKGPWMTEPSAEPLSGGRLNSAVANAVLRVHSHYAGRPAKARAFFRHNLVVVLMEDSMTTAEQSLVAADRQDAARDVRRHSQEAMRPALVEAIALLTGCVVVAFLTDNLVSPDLIVELYVLDRPLPGEQPSSPVI